MGEPGDLQNNGVNIVIQNKKGDILLVRHNYKDKKWSLPGGGIKKEEPSNRAIIREVREETGLIILRPILVADVQLVINWRHKVLLFTTTQWDGILNPLCKDEISDVRFFKQEDIKDNQEVYRAQRILVQIFESAYPKLPLPVYALATDPPHIEW